MKDFFKKINWVTLFLAVITALGAPGVIDTASDALTPVGELEYSQSFDDIVFSAEEYRESLGEPGGIKYDGNKFLISVVLHCPETIGGDGLPSYSTEGQKSLSFILFTKKTKQEAFLMIDKGWAASNLLKQKHKDCVFVEVQSIDELG